MAHSSIHLLNQSNVMNMYKVNVAKGALRDEDGVDEVVGGQVGGAGLPGSEGGVEVPAVEERLDRLHGGPGGRHRKHVIVAIGPS